MPKSRSLSMPNVSYKNRHDTNFATKRKVFKGQPYPNGKANTVDTTDSSVGYATVDSDDETESFDENEINADESEIVFSGFSMENTKKELIEYAVANNIPVKSWWGKQKILDVLSN